MIGQIPGTGIGPVFQPPVPPPSLAAMVGAGMPVNTGDIGGSGGDTDSTKQVRRSPKNGGTGESSGGTALVRVFWIVRNAPAYGAILLPTFFGQFTPTSSDAAPMTVQVQTASDNLFTVSMAEVTMLTQTHNVMMSASLGPFADDAVVWIRGRSGDGTLWSDWTQPIRVTIDVNVGNAFEYIYENVGLVINDVGLGVEYIYENVGLIKTDVGWGIEYIYEGDVNTAQPMPVLWAVSPVSGRAGDGFKALGVGFGATQAQWNGGLEMLINGSWTGLSVTSWVRVAASGDAYDPTREITPNVPIVDPEHEEIEFTAPNTAYPPGHQIRGYTQT